MTRVPCPFHLHDPISIRDRQQKSQSNCPPPSPTIHRQCVFLQGQIGNRCSVFSHIHFLPRQGVNQTRPKFSELNHLLETDADRKLQAGGRLGKLCEQSSVARNCHIAIRAASFNPRECSGKSHLWLLATNFALSSPAQDRSSMLRTSVFSDDSEKERQL